CFRDAVLELAGRHAFARRLVNSGRLSVPSFYTDSPLNTADVDVFAGDMVPGAPMDDGPLDGGRWLIDQLGGRFRLLLFVDDPADIGATVGAAAAELALGAIPVETLVIARREGDCRGLSGVVDANGVIARRYDARPGTVYLARPDQHVAARWRKFDAAEVRAALARATCNH
ncbi:MAG: FAD-dependent oxidoreductase, partial [Gammaproteobacteria bacterium]|nr:FAD-dependent oxidoreductase [Gammaproteobacteria bacterium]